MDRARLTLPDVVLVACTLFVLAALVPVFMSRFEANLGSMSTGTAYVWRLVVPVAIVVFSLGIWRKATAGGGP